ncbi:VTT domain-containing protein [Virgibacillus sp. YIM 98842]|uniref:DedA family protein n=1 Tax=Virgibacillus sp. YIM 98842 TaxID=2663533 RepID=UPI0013D8E3C5|nr:VTT domain-containing protein [Virgibacillus sp. YIM 98842]
MVQQFLDWLNAIGLPGLYLAMFLEGSSIPMPGVIIVLTFGYLLSPGFFAMAAIAAVMSLFYTCASLIPFYLAAKLESKFPERLKRKLAKSQIYFNRYGTWSIAFSRPFGVGNYISYIAGLSKVNPFTFTLLTFLGIYPWCVVMLWLGNYFNGNIEAVTQFFYSREIFLYGIIGIIFALGLLLLWRKYK